MQKSHKCTCGSTVIDKMFCNACSAEISNEGSCVSASLDVEDEEPTLFFDICQKCSLKIIDSFEIPPTTYEDDDEDQY